MIRAVDTLLDRTIVPGYTRLGFHLRRTCWTRDDPAAGALRGRTAMVTGANSGIGKSIATRFAALGAATVLAVRDLDRGGRARREILDAVPGADVELAQCDVAEPASVDACADALARDHGTLDVLVHNAGVLPIDRTENSAGHELTLATHVLGPLRLTDRLTPLLASAGDARIIFVASGGMYAQPLPVRDLEYRRGEYRGATAYARTKRMQVAFAPLLDGRLADQGVSVHSMHPGWVDTPGISAALPASVPHCVPPCAPPTRAPTPRSGSPPPRRRRCRDTSGTTGGSATSTICGTPVIRRTICCRCGRTASMKRAPVCIDLGFRAHRRRPVTRSGQRRGYRVVRHSAPVSHGGGARRLVGDHSRERDRRRYGRDAADHARGS